MFERLQLWFDMPAAGFKTTFEKPEPSRSDCHAWGAHPLYHYFATIIGIEPVAPGFRQIVIRPQLGPLTHVRGALVHPCGQILADLRVEDGTLVGEITLPDGVDGKVIVGPHTLPLHADRTPSRCHPSADSMLTKRVGQPANDSVKII